MLDCLVALRKRVRTLCKKTKPIRKLWSSDLNVSTMEVSNQFKQVFEFIDENGDGKISASELSQVLLCLGYKKSMAAKEAEGMVRELDSNGDGFVELDEFMDAIMINDNNGGTYDNNSDGSREYQYDHYLMDAFLAFDSDKNGKISAKELRRVLVKLGCDKCSLGECKRMIKGVDKDGDGFVDFEEFRLMMTKKQMQVSY